VGFNIDPRVVEPVGEVFVEGLGGRGILIVGFSMEPRVVD